MSGKGSTASLFLCLDLVVFESGQLCGVGPAFIFWALTFTLWPYIIQQTVVIGFADVEYRPLRIGGCHDLVHVGSVLIGCEDANLSPGNLLFMDVTLLMDDSMWRSWDACISSVWNTLLARVLIRYATLAKD